MRAKLLITAFLLLLLTACERNSVTNEHATEENGVTGRNVTAQYMVPVNSCASITNIPGNFEICLDSVVFDNRCPPNVSCIVAGDAICRFYIRASSTAHMITLHTTPGPRRQWEVFQMRITLDSLLPYINQGTGTYHDYRAYLKVTPI